MYTKMYTNIYTMYLQSTVKAHKTPPFTHGKLQSSVSEQMTHRGVCCIVDTDNVFGCFFYLHGSKQCNVLAALLQSGCVSYAEGLAVVVVVVAIVVVAIVVVAIVVVVVAIVVVVVVRVVVVAFVVDAFVVVAFVVDAFVVVAFVVDAFVAAFVVCFGDVAFDFVK